MQTYGVMGHLYAWATPEYMLNEMSLDEILAYIGVHCPVKKDEYEAPDRESFKKHYPGAYTSEACK